ncbi:MAG: hypothetical protein IK024_11435 [Treponema sp.]|nr:hypothetical protein [Treponema sp.]
MKKVKLLFIACLLGAAFAFTSCQSSATVQKDSVGQIPLSNSNYEILGRLKVVEENTVFIGFGAPLKYSVYYKLLEEAQKTYPEADDVVNITVDFEGQTALGFQKGTFTTTAIIIKYK